MKAEKEEKWQAVEKVERERLILVQLSGFHSCLLYTHLLENGVKVAMKMKMKIEKCLVLIIEYVK